MKKAGIRKTARYNCKMIMIFPNPQNPQKGRLYLRGRFYDCALGRNGITRHKKEGDGCTPVGRFPLRPFWRRPDRPAAHWHKKHAANMRDIQPNDGWSDDPRDPNYNRLITRPHRFRHERLWRDDGHYDVIIPLGYNDDPPQKGRGSAIFFHLTSADLPPTEGCVAVTPETMQAIWGFLRPNMWIHIRGL